MASDDETFACDTCSIYFTSASTLRQHVAACHTAAPPVTPRPAASSAIDPATNLEVAPLLRPLGDQKDLLILRALQRQPALADLLLGMAAEPISRGEAAAVEALSDGAAAEVAVRSYLEIGATENATLLGALSRRCRRRSRRSPVALPAGGGGGASRRRTGSRATRSRRSSSCRARAAWRCCGARCSPRRRRRARRRRAR